MYEIMQIVLGLVAMFVIVGGVAYFLQNRARAKGNLFTQPAGRPARVTAFLLGLLFGAAFLTEIGYSDRYHVILPILSVLLIAYSLGHQRLLEVLQKKDK